MPTQSGLVYADTCAVLDRQIIELNARIRASKQNESLRDSYEEKIKTFTNSYNMVSRLIDVIKPLNDDVQEYSNKRRVESMQNINNALRLANEIIPEAVEGIHFVLDGDEAWLETADGLLVDATEGNGYKQVSSVFVRGVVCEANPQVLDLLLLDESFSKVSVDNSTTLSLYLNVLCQNKQVISIEQKPQVYSNIDGRIFHFRKNDEYTEISYEDIKRGGEGIGSADAQTAGDEVSVHNVQA